MAASWQLQRRPPSPEQFAEREDHDAADDAKENPDREVDLLFEFLEARAEARRALKEHRPHKQNERDRGRDEGDDLEQHDPVSLSQRIVEHAGAKSA
jgi:hypothetical protein